MKKLYYFDQQIAPSTDNQTLLSKMIKKRGASIQKVDQLLKKNKENIISSAKKTVHYSLELIRNEMPELFGNISMFSANYFQGSIANVFQAKLQSGELVAIKVLKKDIEQKLENDFSTNMFLSSTVKKIFKADKFKNLDDFSSRFIKNIFSECDLEHEYKNYKQFNRDFPCFNYIKLPTYKTQYVSKNILVSNWIEESADFDLFKALNKAKSQNIQDELHTLFILRPLTMGIIQEDTNLGNFILEERNINIVDFGKTYAIPLNMRIALVYCIYKLNKSDKIDYSYILKLIGYDIEKVSSILHLMPKVFSIIFEPFVLENLTYDKWNPTQRLNDVLGESKWTFRSAGPYSFFKIIRSAIGYFKFLNNLDYNLSVKGRMNEVYQMYEQDISIIDSRVNDKTLDQNPLFDKRKIKIIISKAGSEVANVTLPFNAIYEIENLIPKEVKSDSFEYDQLAQEIRRKATTCTKDECIYNFKSKSEEILIYLLT